MASALFVISTEEFMKPVCSLQVRAVFEEDLDRRKNQNTLEGIY